MMRRGVHGVRGPSDIMGGRNEKIFARTNVDHRFLSSPAEPRNFGSKFALPRDTSPMKLQVNNAHELDKRIDFDAAAHVYYVDGEAMELSVTEMIDGFFEKFDADLVISKMMAGSRWPREGYMKKDGTPYTEEEIKAKWDSIGEYARNRGTWMHYNIELLLNGLQPSNKLEEMAHVLAFKQDFIEGRNLTPYRTEWRIAAPELSLAGSIDFVGRFNDGSYGLLDWKRSKNLEGGLQNNFNRKAAYPLEDLDDCEGSKYFLQLNVYKYILERHYGIHVSYMGVVSFHPNLPSYFLADAPVMAQEVEAMIEEVKRRRAQQNQQRPLPSSSGSAAGFPTAAQEQDRSSAPSPSRIPF